MIKSQKILDATSGSGQFKSRDGLLDYQVTIDGTPIANIEVYYIDGRTVSGGFEGFMLKASCTDWGSAVLNVEAKTDHEDDDYTSTGIDDQFTEDELKIFYYK